MVENHPMSGATYRAQLTDIVRRAKDLEARARREYTALPLEDPQRAAWTRIERRYATVRGNAQHLLLIHDWQRQRQQPLMRILRYLNLL
jgi:hypothetical protein